VQEWLPAIMQGSSTKSLQLSSIYVFDVVTKGLLMEAD